MSIVPSPPRIAQPSPRKRLTRFAWLSIAAALTTISLKVGAYFLTDSVGLLSDAVESAVNLAAAVMALAMLTIAARPADTRHAYGHSKAEYFSSGAEGAMILIAALSITCAAIDRLVFPRPLERIGMGLVFSLVASAVNFAVARVLARVARRYHSISLEADARHLMTDVWTSGGILIGVGAIAITGWNTLDPVVAIVVAANIIRPGVGIVRRSVLGLMDTALPAQDIARVRGVLQAHGGSGIQFHALRTRQAGARRFVSLHVIVPGEWTVHRGHTLLEQIEEGIRRELPGTTVFTHLESLDDPASWEDVSLDRTPGGDPPSGSPGGE
ncbi:MAG TPA: cation diffusion facilitator family transporter [Bacteroidota bacterium]|nr:cation diffusion facilitator family transporter [Bacteroidota bacterium]